MIRAALDTRHFFFEAYGTTTSHALKALKRGLITHAKQYDLEPDWFEPLWQHVNLQYLAFSTCYRDQEALPKE